jgi:hypothetical protein
MIGSLLLAASLLQDVPTHTVGGVVINAVTGSPLSKTRVFLAPTERLSDRVQAITGADGRFRFDGVRAGKYALSAERLGFTPQHYNERRLGQGYSSAIVAGEGETTDALVFRMIPGAAITGTVVDSNGDPVPYLVVQAVRAVGRGARRRQQRSMWGVTDDRGIYRIHSLPSGTYAIAAASGSTYPQTVAGVASEALVYPATYFPGTTNPDAAATIQLFARQEYRADMVVRPVPAARVQGTIVGGETVQGSYVNLVVPGLFGGETNALRRAYVHRGSFTIDNVPQGRCVLYLWDAKKRPLSRRPVEVVGPETTVTFGDIRLPEVTAMVAIQGHREETNGPTVLVLMRPENSDVVAGQIGKDGKATLPSLLPGRYEIMVRGQRELAVVSFEARGATRTADGMLDIPETGTVDLRIVADASAAEINGRLYRDGKPQAGVTALLVSREHLRNIGLYRLDQSDSDGSFAWHGVLPGKYMMFAFEDGEPYDYLDPDFIQTRMADAQPLTVTAEPKQKARLDMKAKKSD